MEKNAHGAKLPFTEMARSPLGAPTMWRETAANADSSSSVSKVISCLLSLKLVLRYHVGYYVFSWVLGFEFLALGIELDPWS